MLSALSQTHRGQAVGPVSSAPAAGAATFPIRGLGSRGRAEHGAQQPIFCKTDPSGSRPCGQARDRQPIRLHGPQGRPMSDSLTLEPLRSRPRQRLNQAPLLLAAATEAGDIIVDAEQVERLSTVWVQIIASHRAGSAPHRCELHHPAPVARPSAAFQDLGLDVAELDFQNLKARILDPRWSRDAHSRH